MALPDLKMTQTGHLDFAAASCDLTDSAPVLTFYWKTNTLFKKYIFFSLKTDLEDKEEKLAKKLERQLKPKSKCNQ